MKVAFSFLSCDCFLLAKVTFERILSAVASSYSGKYVLISLLDKLRKKTKEGYNHYLKVPDKLTGEFTQTGNTELWQTYKLANVAS